MFIYDFHINNFINQLANPWLYQLLVEVVVEDVEPAGVAGGGLNGAARAVKGKVRELINNNEERIIKLNFLNRFLIDNCIYLYYHSFAERESFYSL